MQILFAIILLSICSNIHTYYVKDLKTDLKDEILEILEDDIIENDEIADVVSSDSRWRFRRWRIPRIPIGKVFGKVGGVIRLLKPTCLGCAGICEVPVPGRCACRTLPYCRYG